MGEREVISEDEDEEEPLKEEIKTSTVAPGEEQAKVEGGPVTDIPLLGETPPKPEIPHPANQAIGNEGVLPAVPGAPLEPVTPVQPGPLGEPLVPGALGAATVPGAPVIPGTAIVTGAPGVPEAPGIPDAPVIPGAPLILGTEGMVNSELASQVNQDPAKVVKPTLKKPKNPPRKIEVEEYYVKYKSFSYLHCEWRTEEELTKGDKRVNGKIKRFKMKRNQSNNMMDFVSILKT